MITASEVYPPATREAGDRRRELAPEIHRAFGAFSKQVFADGALPGPRPRHLSVLPWHRRPRPRMPRRSR